MLARRMIMAAGGADALTYEEILRDTYGASEVWPLVDIVSGTTVPAFVDSARNGVLSGLALQNDTGPIAGTLAPLFDGVDDYCDLLTASLTSIFNGTTGSMVVWIRVLNATWADGVRRAVCWFNSGSANYAPLIRKNSGTNNIEYFYRANNITELSSEPAADSELWMLIGVSWDKTAGADGEFRAFRGEAGGSVSQIGSVHTGIGVYSGALAFALLGDTTLAANAPFKGWMAYLAVRYGATWALADFQGMLDDAGQSGSDPLSGSETYSSSID